MFSTNEPRPTYNVKILVEAFERENKYFRIHEVFNPKLDIIPLTGKFYSVHDKLDLSKVDSVLLQRIKLYRDGTPRQKYPYPVTESQRYGWIPDLLVPLRKGDTRYYAPRNASISKINVTLKKK